MNPKIEIMNQVNNIEQIDPKEFTQHVQHKESFLAPVEKQKVKTYHESITRYGKVKPVVYVEANNEKMVIDGWGYIQYALANNIQVVEARKVDAASDEDINRLMLELQFSDHNSPQEEYNIYKVAYGIHNKGKGYRSDIEAAERKEAEIGQAKLNGEKIEEKKEKAKAESRRRENVYDKIASMTNAPSTKRVQFMLYIGNTNPLYFERMEIDRMSLHTAYIECQKDKKGEMPDPPKVKQPVFVKSMTEAPKFTEPTRSDEQIITDDENSEYYKENGPEKEDNDYTNPAQNTDNIADNGNQQQENGNGYLLITGVCEQTGELRTIKITKSDLEKQWNQQKN